MAEKLTLLIRKCRLNQEDAQQDLYDSFFELAEVICSGYSDVRDEQLELIELGFQKVFKYIHHVDTTGDQVAVEFNHWFRKMMIYAAVECFRNNFKHSSFLYLAPCKLQTFVKALDKGLHPSLQDLRSAISILPPSNKLILNLVTMHGFNSRDIAQCLEISHENAQMLISKSIERIRQLLVKRGKIDTKYSCRLQ